MSNKVLVTGGAGYIGSHTVVALIEAGYQPVIIDNFENSNRSVIDALQEITRASISFYDTDITDKKALDTVWSSEKPDFVIHFAAKKAVGESVSQPLKYYQTNIVGLLNVLTCMHEHTTSRLVFSSSCTVYGEPDTVPVTEATPQKPATSPYGVTKQMGERIIQDATIAHNFQAVALRYFNPVGAHPSAKIGELPLGTPNNLVPYLTQATAGLRPPLTIFGNDYPTADGTCIRDFIHVMDLAEAHVAAVRYAEKTNDHFTVCNVGTGKGSSVLELIKAFERATGKKPPYAFGPRRAGDIERIWADTSYSEKLLGWHAKSSIDDAMRDAWNWQLSLAQE